MKQNFSNTNLLSTINQKPYQNQGNIFAGQSSIVKSRNKSLELRQRNRPSDNNIFSVDHNNLKSEFNQKKAYGQELINEISNKQSLQKQIQAKRIQEEKEQLSKFQNNFPFERDKPTMHQRRFGQQNKLTASPFPQRKDNSISGSNLKQVGQQSLTKYDQSIQNFFEGDSPSQPSKAKYEQNIKKFFEGDSPIQTQSQSFQKASINNNSVQQRQSNNRLLNNNFQQQQISSIREPSIQSNQQQFSSQQEQCEDKDFNELEKQMIKGSTYVKCYGGMGDFSLEKLQAMHQQLKNKQMKPSIGIDQKSEQNSINSLQSERVKEEDEIRKSYVDGLSQQNSLKEEQQHLYNSSTRLQDEVAYVQLLQRQYEDSQKELEREKQQLEAEHINKMDELYNKEEKLSNQQHNLDSERAMYLKKLNEIDTELLKFRENIYYQQVFKEIYQIIVLEFFIERIERIKMRGCKSTL